MAARHVSTTWTIYNAMIICPRGTHAFDVSRTVRPSLLIMGNEPLSVYRSEPKERVHIVLFKYLPSISPYQKIEIAAGFVKLADKCRRLDTHGNTYIRSIEGGVNQSDEGFGHGLDVRVQL